MILKTTFIMWKLSNDKLTTGDMFKFVAPRNKKNFRRKLSLVDIARAVNRDHSNFEERTKLAADLIQQYCLERILDPPFRN